MIAIDLDRCDGCGVCVEICPNGAIYLVDGKAVADASLCRDCESCIAACPREAISIAGPQPSAESVRLPVVQPEPAVIQIRTQPTPVSLRTRVLPIVGAALTWAGREIVPRLADIVLDGLAYPSSNKRTTSVARDISKRGSSGCGNGQGRGGRRRRQRRRRG